MEGMAHRRGGRERKGVNAWAWVERTVRASSCMLAAASLRL